MLLGVLAAMLPVALLGGLTLVVVGALPSPFRQPARDSWRVPVQMLTGVAALNNAVWTLWLISSWGSRSPGRHSLGFYTSLVLAQVLISALPLYAARPRRVVLTCGLCSIVLSIFGWWAAWSIGLLFAPGALLIAVAGMVAWRVSSRTTLATQTLNPTQGT